MNNILKHRSLRVSHIWLALLLTFSLLLGFHSPQPAKAVTWDAPNFISETFIGPSTLLEKVTAITWMNTPQNNFVLLAQKKGSVRVFDRASSSILTARFISLESETNNASDRGLLGITVDPDFPIRPYVYLLYTYDPPELPFPCPIIDGANNCRDGKGARVSRLVRVEADPNAVPPYSKAKTSSLVVLLGTNSTYSNIGAPDVDASTLPDDTSPPSCDVGGVPVQDCLPIDSRTHTIGTVIFGPDKKLYVSNGDGSEYSPSVDRRALRAQNIDSLAGKVMRIDPDTGQGLADNPFYDGNPNSNRSKVWMYGLRNPFRITIHPTTGEVYVGDVGFNVWEEINVGKGKNFGWPCYEGVGHQPAYENDTNTAATCAALYAANTATPPMYTYQQVDNNGAAMAGAFYFGSNYPSAYNGALFIGDYALDRTEYIKFNNQGQFTVYPFAQDMADRSATTSFEKSIVQMIPGPEGDLYYVIFDNKGTFDEIRRIRYTGGNAPPVVELQASPTNGQAPLTVNFNASASFDPEGGVLSYDWDFGDGSPHSNQATVSHTYNSVGTYTARLTVTEPGPSSQSSTKTQLISVGNDPPAVTISAPVHNSLFNIGDTIQYAGTASDPQEGDLSASIRWNGILHHDDHTHPEFEADGASGKFNISDHADAMWFELCATVTDSGGLSDTECVNIVPRRVQYTFTSQPAGFEIIYEAVQRATPLSVESIVGATQQISTPQYQKGWRFVRWEDGSTSTNRTIRMGSTPTTITAFFERDFFFPLIRR